jgi:hypothetical protein
MPTTDRRAPQYTGIAITAEYQPIEQLDLATLKRFNSAAA